MVIQAYTRKISVFPSGSGCANRTIPSEPGSTGFALSPPFIKIMKKRSIILIIIVLLLGGAVYYYFSNQRLNPVTRNINPRAYGPRCGKVNTCNNLVAINCQAEVDGSFYYVNADSGEIVGRCGGECDRPEGCPTPCPPKEWTCK